MEGTRANRWWIKSVITVPDHIGTKIKDNVPTDFHVLNFWPQSFCACICSPLVKGSLVGETSVLRTFRMSGKELVKERVSQRKR